MSVGHRSSQEPPFQGATTWQERLQRTVSAEDVVGVARDFVAQFSPYELFSLPEGCRPPAKFVDGEDINDFSFELARNNGAYDAANAEVLQKLIHFFPNASARLAEIETTYAALAAIDEQRS